MSYRKLHGAVVKLRAPTKYLVSNFDEQRENNDDEHVVKDADTRCQGRRHTLSRTPTDVVKDADTRCQGRRQFQWWCRWSWVQRNGCWQDTASGRHLSTRMSWCCQGRRQTLSRTPTPVVKHAGRYCQGRRQFQWWCRYLECNVTDVGKIQRQVVIFRRGCRDVVPDITRQRCVLHRCQRSSQLSSSSSVDYILAAGASIAAQC